MMIQDRSAGFLLTPVGDASRSNLISFYLISRMTSRYICLSRFRIPVQIYSSFPPQQSHPKNPSFSEKMASILASATQAVHSAAASLLAKAQIEPGATIPLQKVKEDAADTPFPLVLKGKNVIVRAFALLWKRDTTLTRTPLLRLVFLAPSLVNLFLDQIYLLLMSLIHDVGTCSAQVPGYIKSYDQFKAKGVNEIFVVAINDVFVMK